MAKGDKGKDSKTRKRGTGVRVQAPQDNAGEGLPGICTPGKSKRVVGYSGPGRPRLDPFGKGEGNPTVSIRVDREHALWYRWANQVQAKRGEGEHGNATGQVAERMRGYLGELYACRDNEKAFQVPLGVDGKPEGFEEWKVRVAKERADGKGRGQ